MYLENTNMNFDSQSHMQFGENKIGEDGGLMISVKGGNILYIGDELSWNVDGCKIKLGGYDTAGGKVIIGNDDWYIGQKDGYIYHNGKQLFRIPKEEGIKHDSKKVDKLWDKIKDKVNYAIDENSDIIDINGDKYVEQMMINMILIEKIKHLEDKLAKIRN
jgi:hypothetical protein